MTNSLIIGVILIGCYFPELLMGQSSNEKECKWKTNLTDSDIETLPSHRYAVLEDCLYYFLSQKAKKDYGKDNALMVLPPTKDQNIIEVTIHKTMIRQMWMNEAWKQMHVNGYMLLSWKDSRMSWNSFEWKLDELKIKSYGHLWMPDIYSEKYKTSVQANDFTIYQDILATKAGNMSARLEYRMQARCQVDFSNYPNDVKHCCFNLRSYMFRDIVKFNVLDTLGHLDLDQIQTNWDIKKISVTPEKDNEDQSSFVRFCIDAGRKSSTLRIEHTIPMVISAILVFVAPLFGHFKHQVFVKLFALLLQFLCFQFLVSKTPQLGFGDVVPRIYKFYEFTLAMTMVSLLFTLVVSAIARMNRSLPPPHGVVLAAGAVNSRLCCSEETGEERKDDATASSANYRKDWNQLWAFLNNVVSLLLIVIYILGVIILCS